MKSMKRCGRAKSSRSTINVGVGECKSTRGVSTRQSGHIINNENLPSMSLSSSQVKHSHSNHDFLIPFFSSKQKIKIKLTISLFFSQHKIQPLTTPLSIYLLFLLFRLREKAELRLIRPFFCTWLHEYLLSIRSERMTMTDFGWIPFFCN